MAATKKKVDLEDIFDDGLDENREIIPTGIKSLDPNLGGGIPTGVLGELYGPTGSGKTSAAYCHIAEQQKLGNISVLIDAEGSWNPAMGARYGIQVEHTNAKGHPTFRKSSKPEMQIIEVLFDRIKTMLYNMPEVRFILVDSLAALSTQAATEKKVGDQTNTDAMQRASVLSFYMRELKRWITDTGEKCTVAFINHEKEVIGMNGYGPPKTDTGGGKALKFYSSFRLKFAVVKTEKVKIHDPVTKQDINKEDKLYIRVTATKNRFHPPFQPSTFIFDVGGGTGIDKVRTGIAHALAQGVITVALDDGKKDKSKKGKPKKGYYAIPAEWSASGVEEEIHGIAKLTQYFELHEDAFERLEDYVVANLSKSGAITLGVVDDDEDEPVTGSTINDMSEDLL